MDVVFADRNIMIDGRPTFVFSGEFQYFRTPHDQWKDRLEKLKSMGLNAIGAYFPWNFHSTTPGQADFGQPRQDIGKFLDLAAYIGLYVIARPGPYICNEWDLGGYPGWLLAEQSGDWRTAHPDHLKWCRQWYKSVNAVIAPRQKGNGGPVILYQLENEHYWGDRQLFEALAAFAGEDGITVPLVCNNGGSIYETETSCATDGLDIYTPVYEQWRWRGWFDKLYRMLPKDAPMMLFEYNGGTVCLWGDAPPDETRLPSEWIRTLTGMYMGKGANLTNFFIAAGGVSPRGYASDHTCTNYMCDAAISHWGGLGRKFYHMRLWAEAIDSVNETFSTSKPWDIGWGTSNANVECLARRSADGTFFFLHNNTVRKQEFTICLPDGDRLPGTGKIAIHAKSMELLFGDIRLSGETILDFCSTPIMKLWRVGNRVSIVTYADKGIRSGIAITSRGMQHNMSCICSEQINVSTLSCFDCEVRIYAVTTALAEKTWFADNGEGIRPLFTNLNLVRPGMDECENFRAEAQIGQPIKIVTNGCSVLDINGREVIGIIRGDDLSDFCFDAGNPGKMEIIAGKPVFRVESSSWRVDDKEDSGGWRPIGLFDGHSESLLETGYYQYKVDFETTGELPSTIEFTGVVGVEAEFFLNGMKLGVFPPTRPVTYHGMEQLDVSFPAGDVIKEGMNRLAVCCSLIGRHNLGRHIFTGILRPVLLYGSKEELCIGRWKEFFAEAAPVSMDELENIPPQAMPGFDDGSWESVNVADRCSVPADEFSGWHDVRWYRAVVKLPETMKGKPLFLRLPKVAEAWVYTDGRLVGTINEHSSSIMDFSDFSGSDEMVIAIALRYLNWLRPWVLTQAPVLYTADRVLSEGWQIRKDSQGEREGWLENSEGWSSTAPADADTRVWCSRKVAVMHPEGLISPAYVEMDDHWKSHATLYWNKYPIGMYAPMGPDRRFYVQDGIMDENNTLTVALDGYNAAASCGDVSFGVYEELAALKIRLC